MHFQPTTGQLILFCTQNIACINQEVQEMGKELHMQGTWREGINNIAQSKINRS